MVRPVVKVVVTEQAHVRQEDSRIDIDTVQSIEVISTVSFRNVAVSVVEVPLPTRGAGVIARGSL